MGKLTEKAPVFFLGHGSLMNAIQQNSFTHDLHQMRSLYPNPRAVLVVSAHWLTKGVWVTAMKNPKTIHDFGGFPKELFAVQYPAPGSPEIAQFVRDTVLSPSIQLDENSWGLDHGTWAVLRHIFPEAEIPVLQLSIDLSEPPDFHYQLGRQLAKLRDSGVLIVGSGNIVHNLRQISWEPNAPVSEWAMEFDQWVKGRLVGRDYKALMSDFQATKAGQLSVPTPDHDYPLLYVFGAANAGDELRFTHEGMQNGSISMRSFVFG